MKTIRMTHKPDGRQASAKSTGRAGRFLILGLIVVALFFYRESLYDIWCGIRQITVRELLCSVLLATAAYLLEGMTIACMMSIVSAGFPVWKGTGIAYLCEFYRMITLGSGSGFAEIYYLHKSGIETGTATVLTMHQYLCKKIAMIILGSAGFAVLFLNPDNRQFYEKYVGFMAAGCLICFAVIAFFLCLTLSARITGLLLGVIDWLAVKLPAYSGKLCAWRKQAALLNQSGRLVLQQKRKIAAAVLVQIGKLLLFYAVPAYLLNGNGRLDTPDCMCLMAVAYMLSGVIPAPSGVGALEFVFLLFFTEFVEVQTAVPAILVFRFVTWVVPFLIGGVVNLMNKNNVAKSSDFP